MTGRQRIERLLFVAQNSPVPEVSKDALALAKGFLRSDTLDTKRFGTLHPEPNDAEWMERTAASARDRLARLEMELKGYKASHMKESIRVAYMDLGSLYASLGDAQNAIKHFGLARDYATSTQQSLDFLLGCLDVALWSKSFAQVSVFTSKALAVLESLKKEKDSPLLAPVKAVSGLVALHSQHYSAAADIFLSLPFSATSDLSSYVCPQDVALYGTLCSLLTMDRLQLKAKVVDNPEFRQYLELTPSLREFLRSMCDSKYTECQRLLKVLQGEWRLHALLSDNVTSFVTQIQTKLLKQYLSPYKTVDMKKLAAVFQVKLEDLEDELVKLIEDGTLSDLGFRLDAVQKVLRRKILKPQETLHQVALLRGEKQRVELDRLAIRIQLLESQLVVKGQAFS